MIPLKFDEDSDLSNLSEEEKHEFRNLVVSYRTFMEFLLKNPFLNFMFIISIIFFLFLVIMKVLDISSPYGIPTSQIDLLYAVPFCILVGVFFVAFFIALIFHFNSWNGFKKYIIIWSKLIQGWFLLITILINFMILAVLLTVIMNSYFKGADTLILLALVIYFIALIGFLIAPLYASSPDFLKEFFSYTRYRVEEFKSYREKIKAYSSIWIAYRIYLKDFSTFFGHQSVDIIKHKNLILLSEEILKLDINPNENDDTKATIVKILNDLANINPFDSTKKYISVMENIDHSFDNQGYLEKYTERQISTGRIHYFNIAKLYTIFLILSTIIGLFKLFA